MHIQLDEAEIIRWLIIAAFSTVATILGGVGTMVRLMWSDLNRKMKEANERLEERMKTEEDRWDKLNVELRNMRDSSVTRELLELKLIPIRNDIDFLKKICDRRNKPRSGAVDILPAVNDGDS